MSLSRRSGAGVSANAGDLVKLARGDQSQHGFELGQQGVDLDKPRFALPRAIDLAIDAIEVADLVGIQIHAERNPARAAAEHRDRRSGWRRTSARGACAEGGRTFLLEFIVDGRRKFDRTMAKEGGGLLSHYRHAAHDEGILRSWLAAKSVIQPLAAR